MKVSTASSRMQKARHVVKPEGGLMGISRVGLSVNPSPFDQNSEGRRSESTVQRISFCLKPV